MAEAQTATEGAKKAPKAPLTPEERAKKRGERRRSRRAGNKKRDAKIATDREYAKALFDSRSKRSTDKKSAFRKKKKTRKK